MTRRENPILHNSKPNSARAGFEGGLFVLQIPGLVARFQECSGLGSEHEVLETKVLDSEGDEAMVKTPGKLRWQDINLAKGVTDDQGLWAWRRMVEEGDMTAARQGGTISLLDGSLHAVAEWEFVKGWPATLEGMTLDGLTAIEELLIVHEGIHRTL